MQFFWSIAHLVMGLTLYHTCLMDLEVGYVCRSKGGIRGVVMTISIIFQGNYLSEAITDSAGKAGLTFLVRCRRTASTDK